MQNLTKSFLMLFIAITSMGCISTGTTNNSKPVILITAFGSSYESGLQNLEDLDSAYAKAFPNHEVYWAFTASFIVNKLRNNNTTTIFERETPLQTIEEAYSMFKKNGKKNVAVQIVMVMVGAEMREVLDTPSDSLNVKYGYPLFYNPDDIVNTVNALTSEFGDSNSTYTIFAAHGNDHHMIYNSELIEFDQYLQENYTNTRLGTVEGSPLFQDFQDRVIYSNTTNVKFVPLMLTYGDHITNDVMGDEEDSWKTIIGKPAECSDGMASNPAIQDIFINKTKNILEQF